MYRDWEVIFETENFQVRFIPGNHWMRDMGMGCLPYILAIVALVRFTLELNLVAGLIVGFWVGVVFDLAFQWLGFTSTKEQFDLALRRNRQ